MASLVPALDLLPAHNDVAIPHAPANIEAEQALLGVLLYDNAAFERIGDYPQARHFYEPFHQRLFGSIEVHVRKGQLAEPILLAEQFSRDGAFEDRSIATLAAAGARLGAITAPALVVWGERDPYIPATFAAAYAAALGGPVDIDVRPGAGHWPWLDDDVVIDHVAELLAV